MRVERALNHFETNRPGLARLLGISSQAVQKWHGIVPLDKAALLNKRTAGGLPIEWDCYDERGKAKGEA